MILIYSKFTQKVEIISVSYHENREEESDKCTSYATIAGGNRELRVMAHTLGASQSHGSCEFKKACELTTRPEEPTASDPSQSFLLRKILTTRLS